MAQKKDKNVKVRDLAPKKDAKGGASLAGKTAADGKVSADGRTSLNGPSPSGRTGLN